MQYLIFFVVAKIGPGTKTKDKVVRWRLPGGLFKVMVVVNFPQLADPPFFDMILRSPHRGEVGGGEGPANPVCSPL